MWDLISDLKALEENLVEFFLSRILLLDTLERIQKIIPKRLFNKGIKKPRLKFLLWVSSNWPSNNWAQLVYKATTSFQVLLSTTDILERNRFKRCYSFFEIHWGFVFCVARDQYWCESDIAKAKVIKAVDQNEGKNCKERMTTGK